MSNFTPEQLDAISKEGTNIIVSAGAGSGKTTVLTNRVVRKVKEGVKIERLLILTFTNEAAMNMKKKIRKNLIEENLVDALAYLDQAYITTFDSYALSIVKKYHYLLNIVPNVSIIDSSIIDIKRKKLLDEIFASLYGDESFDDFMDKYTFKDDNRIKDAILKINKQLDLKYDKDTYLDSYIETYYNDTYLNSLVSEYKRFVLDKKDELMDLALELTSLDGEYGTKVITILESLDLNDYDDLDKLKDIKFPNLPRGSSDELKDMKKSIVSLKDEIIKLSSDDDMVKNYKLTKKYLEVIIKIIRRLDAGLLNYKRFYDAYEFVDIAKMAIKVVKENEEVREELKNYYQEIMVDEYQDTNDLQELFISLIQNNNVYMVGDVKQSIYRFRNANPDIFKEKYQKYSVNDGGYKIDLLSNFRSRDEVIYDINTIFDHIMDNRLGNAEYKSTHRMLFGNKGYLNRFTEQNYNLEIYNYNYDKQYSESEIEAFIVANDIKKRINNRYQIMDNNGFRDINYSDICIIMDRGTNFDIYKKIFEYMHIPLVINKDETLNASYDIQVIINLINLIIKIRNKEFDIDFKHYFISVARSFLFEYEDGIIFKMFVDNNFKDNDIYILCKDISISIDELTNEQLLDKIIQKFGIIEKYIKIGDVNNSIMRLEYLNNLAMSLTKLGYTPYDFGEYLINSKNMEIKYSVKEDSTNAVTIMTIHKSKGLEFNVCYFTGLSGKFNFSDVDDLIIYSKKYGMIIPYYSDVLSNTFVKQLYRNSFIEEEVSEKIRLLYVALTRTKEKMIIIAHLDDKEVCYGNLVPLSVRMKYKRFLDILNSIKDNLLDYIHDIDYLDTPICDSYDVIKKINYKEHINNVDEKIIYSSIDIDPSITKKDSFHKNKHTLYSYEEKEKLKFGTYMHYLFEMTDFKTLDIDDKYKSKINNFISKIDLTDAKIYKEYEFLYTDDNVIKHGIIDLVLEYEDHINIYDYKLKDTSDAAYLKQLAGYKKYLTNKTSKKVYTYLYSILDEKLIEIA